MTSTSRPLPRTAVLAAGVLALAGLVAAVALLPAVRSPAWVPAGLVLAVGLHVLAARGTKAVLSSISPLASGAPEAAGYARSVYGTPGRATGEVVALVAGGGLGLGVALLLGQGWLGALGLLVLAGAVALDLHRWERVAASADWVWFQRGMAQTVHQVAIENIRDVSVQEADAAGFTVRHGTRNRTCRLVLRMQDRRTVTLPKTDAFADLDAVEAVANHIRSRQALTAGLAEGRNARAVPSSTDAGAPDEEAMRRALRRLRRPAAASSEAPAQPRRAPPP